MRNKKNQKRSISRSGLRGNGRRNYMRNSFSKKTIDLAQAGKTNLKPLPETKPEIRTGGNRGVQGSTVKRTRLKLVSKQNEVAPEASSLSETRPASINNQPEDSRTGGSGNGGDGWHSPRVTGLAAAVLLLALLATAAWSSVGSAKANDEPLEVRAGAQIASLQLAKEYIYAGSRMLAIEDYGLSSSTPTPTPTGTPTGTPTPTPTVTPTPPPVPGFAVSGQVTLNTSQAVSGATILAKQNGTVVGSAVSDSSGNYNIANLTAGGSFTISSVSPLAFTAADQTVSNLSANQTVNFNATKSNVIISEFRLHGTSSTDDYIELYNQTDNPLDISGISIASSDDLNNAKYTVPGTPGSGTTIIPVRSHYLAVGSGYSLSGYAAADGSLSADIPDGAGVGIFLASNNFTNASRLDAVGFSGASSAFTEGTAINPSGGITGNGQTALFRNYSSLDNGYPADTNDNNSDFAFVATDAAIYSGVQSILGAPGPENRQSPVFFADFDAHIETGIIDSGSGSASPPNRIVNAGNTTIAPLGTVTTGRTFTNNTSKAVTKLRLRLLAITTDHSPQIYNPQAIIRILNEADTTVTKADGSTVPVKGFTLESPSDPTIGGGLNSSITINLTTPLNPGESINTFATYGGWAHGRLVFNTGIEAIYAP